ncbi:MAG: TetR/AcrR family transcriptional regulator [Myxococcales bacterium]|nr:TetR/AcrR family transcriptional regulator [Myxococcales bacterium]
MGASDTRERLLRAAATEIARHGFKGASLRGVAARADIRAASIFHYFPDGKEELARAMLEHIMETIGTRMTPTIDAGSSFPPADLIVQCAAQLWDFMAEYPDYAGALMREAFAPDEETIVDVVRENGQRIVKLATAYIAVAQATGQLADFDIERFLFRLASFTITFHASPTMRRYILGPSYSARDEREAFLRSIREEITDNAQK